MSKETVILLHGIMNSHHHLRGMAKRLRAADYRVININYPSTRYSIEQLVPIIQDEISTQTNPGDKLHFVGFSMGGLLARIIVGLHRPENLGRVVQLASPNQGSEVTDFLKNNWFYRKIYGPAGQDLSTNQDSIKHLFRPIDYELGIIAGTANIAPVSSYLFKGEHDGRVSVERSETAGMKDHITVHANHTFFPNFKVVQEHTLQFLANGMFDRKNQ